MRRPGQGVLVFARHSAVWMELRLWLLYVPAFRDRRRVVSFDSFNVVVARTKWLVLGSILFKIGEVRDGANGLYVNGMLG